MKKQSDKVGLIGRDMESMVLEISFFNTLTGKVEAFKPLRAGEVRMYTCGPTVYDFAHIGNFRTFVFEDLLRRFLEASGFKVKHVMNLTDVDDKTIAGSVRAKVPLPDFTERFTTAFHEDLTTLKILFPNHPQEQPRATREIPSMIRLIETLIQKGIAYVSEGSVYYRVSGFPAYGKLSKKKLEKNITGARVDVDEYEKEEGADFVLWKKAKEGEPSWDSPWGRGRPGWHIECSAMSMHYLGETLDIHAGGEDLIFPHHENEIAQSEAVTGKPFVRYWLHAKHLLVNGEKMSKSKGNFYTLRDLLAKGYDPLAIRYALLSTHYRSPLNFTLEGLKEAGEVIKKLDDCYFQCLSRFHVSANETPHLRFEMKAAKASMENLMRHLSDDLNIAGALAALFDFVGLVNKEVSQMDEEALKQCLAFFEKVDQLLGLKITLDEKIPQEIIRLMRERYEVRKDSRFKTERSLQEKSDSLRSELDRKGWLVKDGKPGEISTLKKKRRVWDK